MKKVFFTLIFALIFMNNAFANNKDIDARYIEDCLAIIEKPYLEVSSSYGSLKYNFDKDEDFLRKETVKKYKEQGKVLPADYKVVGLTKVRQGFEFNMDIGIIGVSGGKYCVHPKKIYTYIGYYVPTIYILKDLPKDSCVYDVALRHEKTHMEIYLHALDYFIPSFKKSVEGLLDKVGVRIANNIKDAEKKANILNEEYIKELKSDVDAWVKHVEEEQMMLDSGENYDLERRICEEVDKK